MRGACDLLVWLLAQWVALLVAGVMLGVVAGGGPLHLVAAFFGFMLLARHAAIRLLGPLWARLRFLEEENRRLAEAFDALPPWVRWLLGVGFSEEDVMESLRGMGARP